MSSVQANIATIHGGIRFSTSNDQSEAKTPKVLPIPEILTLPLAQDANQLAVPLVTVGERVETGQLIATIGSNNGFVVHASSSGTVVAIKDNHYVSPNEQSAPCLVIETDGKDEWQHAKENPCHNFIDVEPASLLKGLTTLGIPGFNYNYETSKPIDVLIINAIECEPLINTNETFALNYAEELINGIKILQHALQAKKCVIAITAERIKVIEVLDSAINDTDIQIKLVENRYPIAHDALLKEALIGKNQQSKHIITLSLPTAYFVNQAVLDAVPWIKQLVSVVDTNTNTTTNYWVRLGTSIAEILKNADISNKKNELIIGSLMHGVHVEDTNSIVTKNINTIFVTTDQAHRERACIRCGDCATVCPVSLQPQQLHKYAQTYNSKRLIDYQLDNCIECGCCNYVCPSHIALAAQFKAAKATILTELQASNNLQRYEDKLTRQEKRQLERKSKTKIKPKQSTLASNSEMDNKQQVIADAVARVREKRKSKANNLD